MTNRTASSKVNAWIAQAEAANMEVTVREVEVEYGFESFSVTIRNTEAVYEVLAMRYIADGNRAKAWKHSVFRRSLIGIFEGESRRLQARQVGWYLTMDHYDARDAGRAA